MGRFKEIAINQLNEYCTSKEECIHESCMLGEYCSKDGRIDRVKMKVDKWEKNIN